MPSAGSVFAELKRRRVFRMLGLYVVAGWVVIQVASTLFPVFDFPPAATRTIVVLVAFGLPVALGLAWLYDLTARGARIAFAAVLGTLVLGGGALAVLAVAHVLGKPAPLVPGAVTHVTSAPGLELDPALSPDGKTLAYAAGPSGEMRIYAQSVSGGRAIPLPDGLDVHQRWPVWSPDGTRVLFHTGGREFERPGAQSADLSAAGIYSVPALGGVPRRVLPATTPGISPALSRDGQSLAFIESNGIYGHAISILSADGSGPARRIAVVTDAHSLRWSPDGAMLAYVTGNARFVLGTAHFGNDAPSALWTVTLRDRKTHRITSGEWLDMSPVWTPDSRALLFISDRGGARDVYRIQVRRTGDAVGSPERITSALNAHGIDLARDGATLAYSAYTSYSHIWAVPLSGVGEASLMSAVQITFGNETIEGFALSADGRWLAYDSNRSGNGDIWKVSVDGGAPQQLTTNPTGDYVQDFSPDGGTISYHSIVNGVRQIFVMNSDGTAAQRITKDTLEDVNPDFCTNADTIIYDAFRGPGLGLRMVSRATTAAPWGAPQLLHASGSDPACSPDSKWVAYIRTGELHVLSRLVGSDRVMIESTDSAARPKPEFAYWSADSRTLYYKAYDERQRGSIWSIPLAGGTPRLLLRLDNTSHPSMRREFATDGRRLYITIAEPESDLWLMELRVKH